MTSAAEQRDLPGAPGVHVAALWQVDQSLVMVREEGAGRWALPGGAVRAGETLAEAVVRATAEQTGAPALCGPFVGWGEVVDDDEHTLTMYFELVVLDPPDIDRRSGTMPSGPSGTEVRCTPDWQVSEVPVVAGLAEFLADQGLIELVI